MAAFLNARVFRAALFCATLAAPAAQTPAQMFKGNPSSSKKVISGYVDPAVCSHCHQDIATTYRLTDMGRSVTVPGPSDTIEDYKEKNTLYHAPSRMHYTMVGRDGVYYQRRYEMGFGGKETNVVEERIDYVIGSGTHARSYLHRLPDGKIVELPVTWYSESAGYWAMSPGYDRENQDFHRAIDGECLSCHNGFPPGEQYPDHRKLGEAFFPTDIPSGIDCQRCHGPGALHVQAALSGKASRQEIRRAIVNPARLSRDRQLEVCMQCHLETDSGEKPNEIRRYGREIESYRPGEPLGDFKIYFDQAASEGKDDKFQIAHQVYRLRMSACFRQSQMTCLTCHDPHQSYRTPYSTARYLAICRTCHANVAHKAALPAGSNCLSCHMPKRRTQDVVHVVMTDHYIQRNKPARDLLAPLAEMREEPWARSGVTIYYPPQLPRTDENEIYLAEAQVKNGPGLLSLIAHLAELAARFAPAEPDVYFELGEGYSKAGKEYDAIRWYHEALRRQPAFRPAIKQLAATLIAQGQYARAIEVLRPAAAVLPADDALFSDLGNAYLRLRQFEPARQALRLALELNPEQPEAQNLLGLLAVQQGNSGEAETRFREAIRRRPDYAEAHTNLGNVLGENGDFAQAEFHFQRAVDLDPSSAAAHRGYGSILALRHSYNPALAEFRRAALLDPRNAEVYDDLAELLLAQGQANEAADEYRQAIRLKPDFVEAHTGLGMLLAGQGKLEEAEREFRVSIRLRSDAYEAHLNLGLVLIEEGKPAEAREHCQKALGSPDPTIHSVAQKALDRLGH